MEEQHEAEDKCNIEDSLCTSDVLDNLQEIEAWETHTSAPPPSHSSSIPTYEEHHVGMPRDQSSPILNPSGLRRSPRIQMLQLNTQKHDVKLRENTIIGAMEDTKCDRRESIDVMDLNDSIFQRMPVSQLKIEEFGKERKTEDEIAANHQSPSCQILRRSQRRKSMNVKDECTTESISSVRIRNGTDRHTSELTPVCLTKYAPEQDNGVCENKRSSAQGKREIECKIKIMKDLVSHSLESPENGNHKQQEETCVQKNDGKKTKVLQEQCLKSLGKTTCSNRKNNKENIQHFDDIHGKTICPGDAKNTEASRESHSPSPHKQSLTVNQYLSTSPEGCSKKLTYPILKPSAVCAQSQSLHSKHCENVFNVNDQQCITPQNSQKKINYDDKKADLNSPNSGRRTGASKDFINKMANTILKSPLSCDSSQSFLSTQEKMELSAWGLPEPVLKCYLQNGVKKMFPWQAECLSLPGVLEGRNLIYSAPTSAGKTLVAELLLLKRVMESGCKGIFILPFVSVAREKMLYMQKLFGSIGVRVEGFMGSQGPPGGLKSTDIAVCTIEKANNLINRLLEDHRVNELGMVVVDELHMLGDSHRGYLLELLLTKLTYVTSSMSSAVSSQSPENKVDKKNIQIIGMSATLPNLELLAGWLDAALYTTDFRPVPLQECVKLGTSVFDSSLKKMRELNPKMTLRGDRDHLMQLCLETVLEGFSVLVFCPSKAWCENLAEALAKAFYEIGKTNGSYPPELGPKLRNALDCAGIRNVLGALHKCPVGLDKILSRSVAFGVAYHHAGLTFDERDIIEGGFRSGSLRVLLATSTLSSGVNLPARRVIIRSPMFGGSILDTLTYKQMVGRAGRKGVDMKGESILICREGEKNKAEILMTSSLPPITSCLQKDASLTSSMKRAILEVIVSGVAKTPQEVEDYCSHTLLAASMRANQLERKGGTSHAQSSLTSCVSFLLENEFIRLQGGGEGEEGTIQHVGTQLGLAVLASGLSPDEGLHVFSELHRARKCFVLENELHIVYQVTPVYVSAAWPDLDWMAFLRVWEALSEDQKRVAQLVGVEESFIVRALKGVINKRVRRQAQQLAVHQRFYASLALQDLVQEVPLDEVASKFGASRGVLQALQQSAATFAGMVTVFCNRLGWHNLELLVAQFRDRLQFGVQRDLCDLVRLSPLLNAQRARHLHSAGLETVAMVANATPARVEEILHAATPFHSAKLNERAPHGTIWLSSDRCVTEAEASALIVSEARQLVQKELGISNIDWSRRIQVSIKPGKANQLAASPQVERRELMTSLRGIATPPTGGTLLRQQTSSLTTLSTHDKVSAKHPRLKGDWKGLLKNYGKKRKNSLSNVSSKTVKENLCSRQTNNEDNSNSAVRLEGAQPEHVEEKFAAGKESPSVDNHVITAEDERWLENNTEKSEKYDDCKGKSGNVVTSYTENKLCRDMIMDGKKNNSQQGIVDVEKCDVPGKVMDVEKNVPDSKIETEKGNRSTLINSSHLLFGRNKTKKKVEAQNYKNTSLFTPESQEDKSDNVFSPKNRKPRTNNNLNISKPKRVKRTNCSISPINDGNRNTSNSIKRKRSTTIESPSVPALVMTEDGKKDSLVQELNFANDDDDDDATGGDGVVVGVGNGEDSNTSLPHSPFMSGRVKIASSTPIMMPEAQSNQSPAPVPTPGSEPASSSVLNFMVNTDFNNSSDLFNESDTQHYLGNKANSHEVSRSYRGIQTKDHKIDFGEVGILDQKKEHYEKEGRGFLQNYSQSNANFVESGSEKDNPDFEDVNSDKICSPKCQRMKYVMDAQKECDSEVKVEKIDNNFCDILGKKNGSNCTLGKIYGHSPSNSKCISPVSNTMKLTDNSHENVDDYILTDSQKNGLLMTMNSQETDGLTLSLSGHKKLDDGEKGESNDTDCLKSSLECHRELSNEKKVNNVTIDSGLNMMYSSDKLKEQCDGVECFGKGEKRKLFRDTKLDTPSKRVCVISRNNHDHFFDKTSSVLNPVSHVASKEDYLTDSTRMSSCKDDIGSLSYFENSASSDLYLSEDKSCVEEKRNDDNKLTNVSTQEDFLNEALLNLSEISCKSSNSPFTLDKLSNKRNSFENLKDTTSEPKDFANEYVSDSFLEEPYENCFESQHRAKDTDIGFCKQDDLGVHQNTVKPLKDSLQPYSSVIKHQNMKNKKRVNEIVSEVEDIGNLHDCITTESIAHRREIAGESQSNFAHHSNLSPDVTFSQLQITPKTEALLEGKAFMGNNREEQISGNSFLSPVQETQGKKRQINEAIEDENNGKLEKSFMGNISSLSEEIMPENFTDSVLYKKSTTTVEEMSGLHTHQNNQQDTETSSELSSSPSSFCIVDVVNDSRVFASFVKELQEQSVVSVALACERAPSQKQQQDQCIGWRITGHNRTPRQKVQCRTGQQVAGVLVENSDLMVVGLAVCWGQHDAYYINLRTTQDEPTSCSLPTPALTDAVPLEERVAAMKNFFSREGQCVLRMWDIKSSIRLLVGSGIGCVSGAVEDPRVAAWMLDPGAKEPNLCNLVMNHHLASLPLLDGVRGSRGLGGLGTTTTNPGSCRVRAAVESVVVFHLMPPLISRLQEVEMVQSFREVEMRSVVELAYMELNGLGFSNKECETQKSIMQEKLSSLENEAHTLGGHSFSLTSPVEISKVLYGELHLPQPSSRGVCVATNTRRRGRGRGAGPTNKEALEKLKPHHPLPDIILQWRKIYSALTKVVLPLQQMRLRCTRLAMDRIYPLTHTFTSTGRITMHEPSLQTIPRDFDIQVTVENTSKNTKKKSLPQHQLCSATMSQLTPFLSQESEKQKQHTVSLRHAFAARPGHVLLAADYSQLELRLLAHLADDQSLLQLLNSGGDVFTLLASHLASQSTEVTTAQRQQAKQVCYGIIYGMGARTLAEQLGMEEEEACILMEQFQNSFPGLHKFTKTTAETARHNGYVTTLMGRRRYLPAITSTVPHVRAQSERQAVNTAIQGSAADLVKQAMVEIQVALRETFPTAPTCLSTSLLQTCQEVSRGAHLVLHLHDELMYEVMSEDVIQVAQLIQKHMEGVTQLSVALPVKIKVGPSWGSMQTLNL